MIGEIDSVKALRSSPGPQLDALMPQLEALAGLSLDAPGDLNGTNIMFDAHDAVRLIDGRMILAGKHLEDGRRLFAGKQLGNPSGSSSSGARPTRSTRL